MKALVSSAPQLLPGVDVGSKEALFDQLSELFRRAEGPVMRRWYVSTQPDEARAAQPPLERRTAEWVDYVGDRLAFVFVAADPSIPVPSLYHLDSSLVVVIVLVSSSSRSLLYIILLLL